MTGPELSRHLGSLDNSHVSTTAHQDPSYTEDIQRNTEFDREQQDLASEAIPSQICEPHLDNSAVTLPSQRQPPQLDNSVVTLPHQQQPLSIACHLPHQSPSTTATSRLVYTTNYHLPTFDTVLTNSVRPSYQVVNPHFPLPHMQSAKFQHLPPSSVPPPAEPLTQFCPSSNHQTFLPVTQPIAAHPDICFATNTEWITRTFPNPATECPPMLQPHCINQPIQQSVTFALTVPVVSTQHPFAASCIKLSPVQIPKFDGDPLAFHDWINIFKASVHENRSISQTHRITYLQNSVSGKAKDLIRGYSCNPAFYNVALAELESRFGSPQHVVTAYIRRLESWQKMSSLNHTLVSFSTFLKQLIQTFHNLHFTADLHSSTVLTLAKEKLPHHLLLKWTEHTVRNNMSTPTLLDFQQWLDIQAKVLETLEPACDRSNDNERSSSTTAPKTSKIKSLACPICAAPHFVYKCPQYTSASMNEKLQKVKDLKLCYNCLGNSHLKPDCPSKIRCQEPNCGASHHTSLHTQLRKDLRKVNEKNISTYKNSVSSKSDLQKNDHNAGTSTQFQRSQNQKSSRQPQFNAAAIDKFPKDLFSVLQIIPVSIINGDKTFDTYALIDPGSTGTYIVDHISSFLSLKTGKKYKLDVQFLSLSRFLSVSATSFDIAPYADNDNKFHVQHAFSTPNINLPRADTTELNDICQNFPQLRHIKFPDINQGKIGVLLGTACVPFTHSLEWIRGAHNCPSGIRTELGWTIAGEFRHSSRKKSTATKHLLFLLPMKPRLNQLPPTFSNTTGILKK